MIKNLSRLAVATLVLSSAAFSQSRAETVQHTPQNGMTLTLKGAILTSVFTRVQMEARIGGFSFGTSSVLVMPTQTNDQTGYTGVGGITHLVEPQFVWGAWAWGLGTLIYTT